MTADESRLLDGGWTTNGGGLWTNGLAFEVLNTSRQLQHVPAGVTRTLDEALKLENLRPAGQHPQPAPAAATAEQAAALQAAMEKLEARARGNPPAPAPLTPAPLLQPVPLVQPAPLNAPVTPSVPGVGAPVLTPTKEEKK